MTRVEKIASFQYITHRVEDISYVKLIDEVCEAGVRWVQLRIKDVSDSEFKKVALEAKAVCDQYKATLIINDHVQIAKEVSAHGVHLGQHDFCPLEARKILGDDAIIGGTANTFQEMENMVRKRVDYIGFGPYRFTKTKTKLSPVVGIQGYKNLTQKMSEMNYPPIVAIGGIALEDVKKLMETGIYGIAVSSGINLAKDRKATTQKWLTSIHQNKNSVVC